MGISLGGGTWTVGSHKKAQVGSPSDARAALAIAETATTSRVNACNEIFLNNVKMASCKKAAPADAKEQS
jgi:hypothetical protein